jgi:hypothetical protein
MAQQLFFKKPLQAAIREGRKNTTIRRWHAGRPGLSAGAVAYSPGLGWLCIDAVESVDLERLGDEDARADGFDDVAGLRQLLYALYPNHAGDGKVWFRVRFSLRDAEAQRASERADVARIDAPGLFDTSEGVKG